MPPNVNEQSCPTLTVTDSAEPLPLKNRKLSDPEVTEDVKGRPEDSFSISRVRWGNFIGIVVGHAIAIYGFITFPYLQCWRTFIWAIAVGFFTAFGVTAGVHRYWCHKTYKAKIPLRIFLMLGFMASGQNSIFQWVRDHRVHHKFSETHADPHNSNRGFFFSHCGWLMLKKHPDVLSKGKQVDMTDVIKEPVAAFSERYYIPLKILFAFGIPMAVPVVFWNEKLYYSFLAVMMRYMYSLNATWSVNSVAHIWGTKPYDKNIAPVESALVSYLSVGEGWHNYHHTFPYDYRAAEIGGDRFNLTTKLIDFFAKIGWAYDRRHPSSTLIKTTIAKRGDGSHEDGKATPKKDENCEK